MKNVMLDLETMSTRADAAIIAIGAVMFDATGVGRTFYRVVTLDSSVAAGGCMDADTVMWWLKQSDDARSAICAPFAAHINDVLIGFSGWLADQCDRDDLLMWGNGSDFDNVVLGSAYRRSDIKQPWKYHNNRCYRTIKATRRDIELERAGTHHNALDDAISQARHLIAIWRAS